MTRKVRTYAGELRHFVESIDIVSDQTFREIRDLVWKYLTDQLEAEYFEIMYRTSIGPRPSLKAHWSSRDEELAWSIHGDEGAYSNPITAAFDNNKPLWLVSPDDSELARAAEVRDQWSRLTKLPPYQPLVLRPIRTAIVVPLPLHPTYGLYFVETRKSVSFNETGKEELHALGEALGIALELNNLYRVQSRLTRDAIRELRATLESAEFPELAKPRLFFAFSNRADRSVIDVVKTVLRTFSDRLEVRDWDQMRTAGNIPQQITHSIARSKFGICYLSEPQPDNSFNEYIDNPNVVFESGMLQAQTNAYAQEKEPTGWIPIREENSPQAPFDFASSRMIIVPRAQNGDLDEQRLREDLHQQVKSLLSED